MSARIAHLDFFTVYGFLTLSNAFCLINRRVFARMAPWPLRTKQKLRNYCPLAHTYTRNYSSRLRSDTRADTKGEHTRAK